MQARLGVERARAARKPQLGFSRNRRSTLQQRTTRDHSLAERVVLADSAIALDYIPGRPSGSLTNAMHLQESSGNAQLAQRVDAEMPRLERVSAELPKLATDSEVSSARTLSIGGIVIGALGLVVAAFALLRKRA